MNEVATISSQLVGAKKPKEYIKFVKWYSIPEPFREPRTQKEFAALIGVGQDTIIDWKKRDGFRELMMDRMIEWGKDKTPNVMARHYKKIMEDGDAQSIKLWYEFYEGWIHKEGREVVDKTFEDLLKQLDGKQGNNTKDAIYTEQTGEKDKIQSKQDAGDIREKSE